VELGWKVLSHVHRRLDALGIEDSFLEKQAYKRELNFMTGADLHDRWVPCHAFVSSKRPGLVHAVHISSN